MTSNPEGFSAAIEAICERRCASMGDPACWKLPDLVEPCEHITPCPECLAELEIAMTNDTHDAKPAPCHFCKADQVITMPNDRAGIAGIPQGGTTGQDEFYCHCEGCGADGPIANSHPEAITLWNGPTLPVQKHDADTVERAKEAVAEALGDALDCTRVWSAWGYGTMSESDFREVRDDEDRLDEITRAALSAIRPQEVSAELRLANHRLRSVLVEALGVIRDNVSSPHAVFILSQGQRALSEKPQ